MPRVLLIEPDRILAKTVGHYIEAEYDLVRAASGQEAINILDKQPFDIIITEHFMEGTNSFEFLYELRSYPDWQSLPVILFSRSYIDPVVLKSPAWQQLGAVHYMYKPATSLAQLTNKLNDLAPRS